MTKERILLVEDENLVAMEIADLLRALGYVVCGTASSGERAIEQAATTEPDLVLMDIRLKGNLDGIEAAQEIRRRFQTPVIFLTAYTDEATLQRAKITEPFGYLIKPFEERELHTAVEMALHNHRMEMRLRASERWLATTLRSIGDAVIAIDDRGAIVFVNPEAEALTGWLQVEVLGKNAAEVLCLAGEGQNASDIELMARVRQAAAAFDSSDDTWLIARDETRIPIEYNAAPLIDDRGQALGVVLVFRDVTERKQAEAENARLYRELQHHADELETALAGLQKLDRLKNEFMQNVSHELRTPLTLVRGYAEFLAEGDCGELTPEQQEMTDRLKRQAIKLSDLVGDISLALAAQARPLMREVVAIDELLLAAVEKHEAPVRDAKLTLAAAIPPDLPPMKGAPNTLARMFDNLLTNAVKFTPEGGMIDVRAQRQNGNVVIEVSDTGIGISSEQQARIFDRFYQVDGASTRRYGGMGLGLALVKEIAEAHAGVVSVQSELGKGSTFRVCLPVGD